MRSAGQLGSLRKRSVRTMFPGATAVVVVGRVPLAGVVAPILDELGGFAGMGGVDEGRAIFDLVLGAILLDYMRKRQHICGLKVECGGLSTQFKSLVACKKWFL